MNKQTKQTNPKPLSYSPVFTGLVPTLFLNEAIADSKRFEKVEKVLLALENGSTDDKEIEALLNRSKSNDSKKDLFAEVVMIDKDDGSRTVISVLDKPLVIEPKSKKAKKATVKVEVPKQATVVTEVTKTVTEVANVTKSVQKKKTADADKSSATTSTSKSKQIRVKGKLEDAQLNEVKPSKRIKQNIKKDVAVSSNVESVSKSNTKTEAQPKTEVTPKSNVKTSTQAKVQPKPLALGRSRKTSQSEVKPLEVKAKQTKKPVKTNTKPSEILMAFEGNLHHLKRQSVIQIKDNHNVKCVFKTVLSRKRFVVNEINHARRYVMCKVFDRLVTISFDDIEFIVEKATRFIEPEMEFLAYKFIGYYQYSAEALHPTLFYFRWFDGRSLVANIIGTQPMSDLIFDIKENELYQKHYKSMVNSISRFLEKKCGLKLNDYTLDDVKTIDDKLKIALNLLSDYLIYKEYFYCSIKEFLTNTLNLTE